MPRCTEYCLGIDLGTTDSCVAVMLNGTVEIIANSQGNRTTPSYVAFTETECLVGEVARNQAAQNPTNTIFDATRLLGRNWTSTAVQTDLRSWPFQVEDQDGTPVIRVRHRGVDRLVSAQEVSATLLGYLRETAEAYLGTVVTKAVVTVPAYCSDRQRQATKDAGTMAGLDILRVLNAPTAAALAYGLDGRHAEGGEKTILVFALGGGTLDVSLVVLEKDVLEVRATAGHTHLGGTDLDLRIMHYCQQEFQRLHQKDLFVNPQSLRRLRTACEQAKKTLSSCTRTTIEVDSVLGGLDLCVELTRARFEDLCVDLFRQALVPVEQVLWDTGLDPSGVDEVLLVGGSTQIPRIRAMLAECFQGNLPKHTPHPDEAVAFGAAIQGSVLLGETETASILLLDLLPHSLGLETSDARMRVLLPRNTTIPCTKQQMFTTQVENQPGVTVQIFEGEHSRTVENHCLGFLTLEGLAPAPGGHPQIEVTFAVDANGILTVSAEAVRTGTVQSVTIRSAQGRLQPRPSRPPTPRPPEGRESVALLRDFLHAKDGLERGWSQLRRRVLDHPSLEEEERTAILTQAETVRGWLESFSRSSSLLDLPPFQRQLLEHQARLDRFRRSLQIPILTELFSTTGRQICRSSEVSKMYDPPRCEPTLQPKDPDVPPSGTPGSTAIQESPPTPCDAGPRGGVPCSV